MFSATQKVVTTVTVTKSRQGTQWTAPLVGGLLALALAAGICAGLIAWGHATFFETDDGARQRFREVFPVLEGTGAAVLGFQRVPVTIDRQEYGGGSGSRPRERLTYRIVVSPLGGLLLIGLALVAGGAVTHRLGGRERTVFASGARMAAVFALACFVLSFLVPLGNASTARDFNGPLGYTVTYGPSHVAAILWPLVWGLIFGSLGTFIGKYGRRWRRELFGGVARRAALTGLATGVVLVLLAGVLTALVGSLTHKSAAAEVVGSARNVAGIAEGVVVGLPHATGMSLLASMGVPAHHEQSSRTIGRVEDGTASIIGGVRQRRVFRGTGVRDTNPTFSRRDISIPRYALGGLLIAIVMTVVTGYRAAAGSEGDVRQAVRSAIVAAACLTFFFWIVGYLVGGTADVTVTSGSDVTGGTSAFVASRLGLLFLPPLWTLGGGLLGAGLRARIRPRTAL
jgi:hypothetical protein